MTTFDLAKIAATNVTGNLSAKPPNDFIWPLAMVRIRLATSAVAGNRQIQVFLTPIRLGVTAAGLVIADTGVVAASTTKIAIGGPTPSGESGANSTLWSSRVFAHGQLQINVIPTNLQAGDTWDVDIVGCEMSDAEGGVV